MRPDPPRALPLRAAAAVAAVATALLVACSGRDAIGSDPGGARTGATTAASIASSAGVYVVTFAVASRSGRLGAVQFEATPATGRSWRTTAGKVVCRNLSSAAMHACNTKGGATLTCALVDLKGIGTPSELVSCDLESAGEVSAADLTVEVIDASDPQAKPADVEVTVTKVQAAG